MNGELRAMLIKHYQQVISNAPNIPTELKKALKASERVPSFIDNLAKEFSHVGFKNISNNKLKDYATEMIMLFINLIRVKNEERIMSEAQRFKIKQQISDKAIIDKSADTGIIDEEALNAIQRYNYKQEEKKEDSGS